MNNEEFVKRIIEVVRETSISDSVQDLIDPPGRKPSRTDLEVSNWFNKLEKNDKEKLNKIIKKTVDSTIFGFFTVLDGVRAIEASPTKGNLELYYKSNENSNLINNHKQEYLHDIFNSKIKD